MRNMSSKVIDDIRCAGKGIIWLFERKTEYLKVEEEERKAFNQLGSIGNAVNFILGGGTDASLVRLRKIRNLTIELVGKLENLQNKLNSIGYLSLEYTYKKKYYRSLHQFYRHQNYTSQWHTEEEVYLEYISAILDFGVPIVSVFLESVSPTYIVWDMGRVAALLKRIKQGRTPLWLATALHNSIAGTSL